MNLILILIILSCSSYGQMGNPDNPANAVANATTALIYTLKKTNVPKDSVSGVCEFSGSNCNGATIELFKAGKSIYTGTLTSQGHFQIPRLTRNQSYVLKLRWPKHKLDETRNVQAGEFVSIKLEKAE